MRVKTPDGDRDLPALWWEDGQVHMIDQRVLPEELTFVAYDDVDAVAEAIADMVVRGAPAIGAAAAYGMALAALADDRDRGADVLAKSRPTANDLFYAIDAMEEALDAGRDPVSAARDYVDETVDRCRRIGEHGADLVEEDHRYLTHCNAGALATVDWGTALAPFRVARREGRDFFVYADETRPREQGRLTLWELQNEQIPSALIADNAAGHFMARGEIDALITGADRIAANGDVANKIGTYEKAVLADRHDIPYYVAAPVSTFDPGTPTGADIPIEERSTDELGAGIPAENPAFDVTPADLVAGVITEDGVKDPTELGD